MMATTSREFVVIDAPQRSEQWFKARMGRLTGSRAADMLGTPKSGKGELADRRDLRMQLVCERLTGSPQEDSFVSPAMQRGVECEPLAFSAYEALTGNVANRSGFLAHTSLMVGCSLDGHIGDFEGLLELKCPKSSTHLGYLRSGKVPANHLPQIIHNLWVTGADYADFLSFDDRFGPTLQTFYCRVHRADVDIAAYELAARLFLSEVEAEVTAIREMR